MAKRKNMGEAVKQIFPRRTGREALAEVTGGPPTTSAPRLPAKAFDITTFRVRRDQVAWLRQEAASRANIHGGKPDSSEVVRELIDARMGEAS